MDNKITSITSNNFICKKCDFKCSKKGDYNRHLLTAKHKRITMDNKITSQNDFFLLVNVLKNISLVRVYQSIKKNVFL